MEKTVTFQTGMTAYLTGLIGLLVVLVSWVTVQHAWRRVFAGDADDPDALAGRFPCRATCATEPCPLPRS